MRMLVHLCDILARLNHYRTMQRFLLACAIACRIGVTDGREDESDFRLDSFLTRQRFVTFEIRPELQSHWHQAGQTLYFPEYTATTLEVVSPAPAVLNGMSSFGHITGTIMTEYSSGFLA